MAHHSEAGREPLRQPDPDIQPLSHRISNISEITDIDANPYDNPPSARPSRHGREPLSSYDSQHSHGYASHWDDEHENDSQAQSPSSWRSNFPYTYGGAYEPVSPAGSGRSYAARALSMKSRNANRSSLMRHQPQETIDEEGYDLSLIRAAAPMGGIHDTLQDNAEAPVAPGSEFIGVPFHGVQQRDEASMRDLREQEARGQLTGGIGQGFVGESHRMRDAELLTSPTSMHRSFSRAFSRRGQGRGLSRAQTIRDAGQDEANRRGEIIEVVMEQQQVADSGASMADISTLGGPDNIAPDEARRSHATFPQKSGTEFFYPQPNWKPFAMRWPWLTMLILLSVALAAMQEIFVQRYNGKNPLLRFTSPGNVDPGVYFTIKFGPTIAAVVFGVLWQFTDFEVRRLEAYYQMSKPGGALAAESINVDYVTAFNFFRPFRALKVGHYAVALSSFATTLAASLVPTFAAASIILIPDRDERNRNPDGNKDFLFSPVWSRLLTSTLGVCAVCGCGLFYLLQTRRSGLIGDVRGIAGLASMAVVAHILMDFRDLDTATPRDIHNKLKQYRYRLQNSCLAPDDANPASSKDRDKYEGSNFSENPHPVMLRPAGSIPFIIALLLFMGFVPTFLFTPADAVTDKASFVVTAMAVGLKLSWGSLEMAVRMMEPYYILSRRHAPSKTLTLDYTALPFGYMPLRALFNGHLLVFLVGFGTIMTEFLTIFVTGLATVDGRQFTMSRAGGPSSGKRDEEHGRVYSGQETELSFYVSFGVCIFILLYMVTVASTVFIRRRHPFLPRQPNTIASVLAFIHQSKMLYSFVGTAKLSSRQMVRHLDNGATYGLGWFVGRDGQLHCGVDQEELISNYKHGVDASEGIEPWRTRWDVL